MTLVSAILPTARHAPPCVSRNEQLRCANARMRRAVAHTAGGDRCGTHRPSQLAPAQAKVAGASLEPGEVDGGKRGNQTQGKQQMVGEGVEHARVAQPRDSCCQTMSMSGWVGLLTVSSCALDFSSQRVIRVMDGSGENNKSVHTPGLDPGVCMDSSCPVGRKRHDDYKSL